MSRSAEHLDALSDLLDRTGGDATRIEAVKKTQNFRRSWVELARCLHQIEKAKRFKAWGFEDLHNYCAKELTLKRATVDKLLLSYRTMHRFAPRTLQRDGVARPLPSLESVSYLSKAVAAQGQDLAEGESANQPIGPKLEALSKAVFDDQRPLREIKRDFDAELFPPKAKDTPEKKLSKSLALVARLQAELQELSLLSRTRRKSLGRELAQLHDELASLVQDKGKREPVKVGKKKAPA